MVSNTTGITLGTAAPAPTSGRAVAVHTTAHGATPSHYVEDSTGSLVIPFTSASSVSAGIKVGSTSNGGVRIYETAGGSAVIDGYTSGTTYLRNYIGGSLTIDNNSGGAVTVQIAGATKFSAAASGLNLPASMRINLAGQAGDVASPVAGDIEYNTTTNKHRGYDGTTWNDLY
ncbi:MAG: hypothetical protein H6833_14180 [Planctomycetes bacterium]|nr:hypothetical protein [Planctomycetota bacterium]